jgi:hypothetical protein
MAVGQISGQMLKDDLQRDGVNLAFETDLIYLDVTNMRVGINTTAPTHDLTVNGTAKSTNFEVSDTANIGNITLSGNTILSNTSTLALTASGINPAVYNARLLIDDLELSGNVIKTTTTDTDIEIQPNGTGEMRVYGNATVYGDLHATGTITADGNLTLGDADTDSIEFKAEIVSNIVPDVNDLYNLGSSSKKWADVWTENLNAGSLVADEILAGGINLALTQGNILYVATNGNDANIGEHQNNPVGSVGRALALAVAGDTVFIYPGTYPETLPLVVPAGVAIRGAGLRSVTITPDSATGYDIFHLNGETTIEDLTISGFNYDAINDRGYAFRFAPNASITSRSPYIRNVSVITTGSVTSGADPRGFASGDAGKGALVDGSVVNSASNEAAMLFHSVTMITPGVDAITMTNGSRIEWLNSFTYFANKGMYAVSGAAGFAGNGKTRIKIENRTGTFNVGNTLSYYDTDGTTLLASGVIESIDGDFFVINGKVLGFETLTDRAGKTVYAVGNAQLATTQQKFGSASLALDGTGDYVSLVSQLDFGFGTGDFTIEGWFYRDTTGVAVSLFDFRTAATQNAPWVFITSGGTLAYYVNGSTRISGAGGITAGSWHHVAVSRSGTNTKMFVNGTQIGVTWTDTTNYIQSPLTIGARFTGALEFFNGYIDDVRVTKGVARYTTTFTAPTSAFTSDLSTVLLLHFNGSAGSTIFTDDGITTQDIRTSAGGTSSIIDVADYGDFGAEVRAIASASVYGNYGAYADGIGNILYLVGQNFAYIGTGKDYDNDPTTVIQANEVVPLNDAKIYYTSVDHQGDFRVGELFYIDQKNGNVSFSAETFNISSLTGVTFTDGSNNTIIDATKIETGNIRISGNDIISITGNIELSAASNQINLTSNTTVTGNTQVTGNFTVDGNTTIGNTSTDSVTFNARFASDLVPSVTGTYNLGSSSLNWEDAYASRVVIDNLEITGNLIRTTVSNADLELRANGTGGIILEDIKVNQNNISTLGTNQDLTITPSGTGVVRISSTQSLVIPKGTTVQQPAAPESGMIRFNTTDNLFEGYNGTYWLQLGGISSIDRKTRITPELTVGANDNTIRFYTNNYLAATLDSTAFSVNSLVVDDLEINNNTIRTTATNADLELDANGTGAVVINSFRITNNTITNTSGTAAELISTGSGYFKIAGSNGVVIPTGFSSDRPGYAVIGMIRYNIDLGLTEIWDGLQWSSVAGSSGAINVLQAEEIAIQSALIIG